MAEETSQRMQFLWMAAHSYAGACPALSAHLMATFAQVDQKAQGMTEAVRQSFCPSCGHLFTPASSSVRGVGRVGVRRKRRRCQLQSRDLEWLVRPPGKRKAATLLIHCRACRKSFLTPRSTPIVRLPTTSTPTLRSKVTPRFHKSPQSKSSHGRPKPSHRRSSMLKSMLQQSSQQSPKVPASPSLAQFLMTV